MGKKDGLGEIFGNKSYTELRARRRSGRLDNVWVCDTGEKSDLFISQNAMILQQAEDPLEEIVKVMAVYKYADEVDKKTTASKASGYKKYNLEAVIELSWGGCIELAELAARLVYAANIPGLRAVIQRVKTDILGPHTIVYFPEKDYIFDPSLHKLASAQDYCNQHVLGLYKPFRK